MLGQDRNNRGFTLAELLLSIAIVLILAALVAPSIANIQRTARIAQLDSAASDIAVAAQQQMTSMKVSGTWLALFDDGGVLAGSPAATGVPSAVTDSHPVSNDLCYMTADQARSSGVLPADSIDSEVRDGDFIIEYSVSTATVFGVFYTDGKTGFFQDQPILGAAIPAQTYYIDGGDSAVKRMQSARLQADPLIGYYGGTPAGATNAVALANPTIWVDEESGLLCIQDTNLSKHGEWLTSLEVLIENQKTGSTATIAFAGLQGGKYVGTYQGGAKSDSLLTYQNSGDTKLYSVGYRSPLDDPSLPADVYTFDLEMLKATGDKSLNALAEGFSYGDTVKVTATVKTGQVAYTPTSSTAYIEWPEPVSMLRVVVTDPSNGEDATNGERITGTYRGPEIRQIPKSGDDQVTGFDDLKSYAEKHTIKNTSSTLTGENEEAAYQRYKGGQISFADALANLVDIEAAVGGYAPAGDAGEYRYQIYELWLGVGSDAAASKKQRIGYMVDNEWKWVAAGETLSSCISGLSAGAGTAGTTTLSIDPVSFSEKLGELGLENEVITIYIRTAPSIDDVRKYITGQSDPYGHDESSLGQIPKIDGELTGNLTMGSRGTEAAAQKEFRRLFENEFGCSSSDCSWALTKKSDSGQFGKNGSNFPGNAKDIRIYYAVTPAFAFNATLNAADNEVTNAALWYYSAKEKTVYSQAMVYPSRSGNPYYMASTRSSGQINADFELMTTRDYLFYRVLKFYGETSLDGKTIALDMDLQYVPFSFQNDARVATLPYGNAINDEAGKLAKVFSQWVTNDTNPKGRDPLVLEADALLGSYHESLDYVGASLYAEYVDAGIGMMYLEFGENETTGEQVTGYSGYLTPGQGKVENLLANDSSITSWGYYALVPSALDTGRAPKVSGNDMIISADSKTVVIKGVSYRAYQVLPRGNAAKARNLSGTLTLPALGDQTYAYTINSNFACAVEIDGNKAQNWGKSEENSWQVRHATQFIGALSLLDKVQLTYVGDCFAQTHTIDMKDVSETDPKLSIKLDNVFTGIYDGGSEAGNVVKNVQYCLTSYYVINNSPIALGRGSGMFPKVAGVTVEGGDGSTSTTKAQIKNIKAVVSGSDFGEGSKGVYEWATQSPYSHVGVIVGYMEDCDMSGCEIVGDADDVPTIKIVFQTTSIRGWGLIFGGAENSTVSDCEVSSINLIATRKNSTQWDGWDENPKMGALGGQAIDTKITRCSVKKTDIGTDIKTKEQKELAIGGLVGDISGGESSCSNVVLESVNLIIAPEQYDAKRKRDLYFGGLAGRSTVAFDDTCSFSQVVLKVGAVAAYDVVAAANEIVESASVISEEPAAQEPKNDPVEDGASDAPEVAPLASETDGLTDAEQEAAA